MLRMFQRYFENIRQARNDADIIDILSHIARDFGFRSAYLIEYGDGLSVIRRVIDTDPERARLWLDQVSERTTMVPSTTREGLAARLPVLRLGPKRIRELPPQIARFVEQHDLLECTVVPITVEGTVVGMAGLAGNARINGDEEAVLPLIGYSLFARMRELEVQNGAGRHPALTNREKEVLALSAEGMTSQEIAVRLGMSPRTVNQHVDNVSDKLGTRNRAHTVAEVIRHHLLD